jgi:hypothetical protein
LSDDDPRKGESMTSRERVRTTLAHREPDRVPVDFGSTTVTGMHALVVERLRAHYGLERRPVTVPVPYNMLGLIEDDLARAMGLDLIGVLSRNTNYGYPNENWKEGVPDPLGAGRPGLGTLPVHDRLQRGSAHLSPGGCDRASKRADAAQQLFL